MATNNRAEVATPRRRSTNSPRSHAIRPGTVLKPRPWPTLSGTPAVVPDPQKKLYREFGVEAGVRALLNPKVWWPLARGVGQNVLRLVRGGGPVPPLHPAGGGLGLPADFLVSAAGKVLAAHYGEHAYDQWPVDHVLRLAESTRSATGLSSERHHAAPAPEPGP